MVGGGSEFSIDLFIRIKAYECGDSEVQLMSLTFWRA